MPINLKEFLAKQLNDHSDSPSGVVQKTYYEWTEAHITDAVNLALCYVYSLIPREFGELVNHTVNIEDCVINLCDVCTKFTDFVSLSIDGNSCVDVDQSTESSNTNSLMDMLSINCISGSDSSDNDDPYSYEMMGKCVLKFDRPLPVGSVIKFMCASPPDSIDNISDSTLCEYGGLIADYALFWLFRTDSESRSNLDRARLHFEGVRDFVTTKLLLEFSLTEDKYELGRRKVDES